MTGHDVRHRLREYVGPLLVQQACRVARCTRRFVDTPRGLAAVNPALDHPVTNRHRHRVDRPARGHRKGVNGLDGFLVGVRKALRQRHTRNKT